MNILKKQRTWDLLGMVLGVIILIVGIVFMASPPDSYSTRSTDYASFGADYYTYQYDATCVVASNTAVTANNLREIGEILAKYFGFLFISMGSLTTVSYGKKYFIDDISEEISPVPEKHFSATSTVANVETDIHE